MRTTYTKLRTKLEMARVIVKWAHTIDDMIELLNDIKYLSA